MINCHCHIFSLDCVPTGYRQKLLLDLQHPVHGVLYRLAKWLVRRFVPSGTPAFDFLDLAQMPIPDIALKLAEEMDEAGVSACTPLMMDMKYWELGGGDVRLAFEEQVEQTEEAVRKVHDQFPHLRMYPFLAFDPRRPGIVDLIKDKVGHDKLFRGVKVYPVMGFEPDPEDAAQRALYEHCVAERIPVTTHCEYYGLPFVPKRYRNMAHPRHWRRTLEAFGDLQLNLAHHGRIRWFSWQPEIEALVRDYANVYTDLSYDIEMWYMPGRYFRDVKRLLDDPALQDRVLYGTDWYMGRYLWTEASYLRWFREYARKIPWCRITFTEEELHQLTDANPKRFLGLSS